MTADATSAPVEQRRAGSPPRALLRLAQWAAATAVATAVSSTGVALVASSVTGPTSVAVPAPAAEVVAAVPDPTTTTVSSMLESSPGGSSIVASPDVTAPATAPTVAATVTTVARVAPTASAPRTTVLAGGSFTVACDGDAVSLRSAVPHDGYRLVVHSEGPAVADVEFVGRRTERARVVCEAGIARRIGSDGHDGPRDGPRDDDRGDDHDGGDRGGSGSDRPAGQR